MSSKFHNLRPFKITKFSNFLNPDWFLPSEASLKCTLFQRLIFELLENRYWEVSSAASSDEDQAKFLECNEHETGVQSFSGRCGPAIASQENIYNSQAGQGIEITLLSTSSLRSSECVSDAGLVLREFFEPGATAGSLFGQYQSFDQKSSFYLLNGAIPPIENGEHFLFPTGDSGFQQILESHLKFVAFHTHQELMELRLPVTWEYLHKKKMETWKTIQLGGRFGSEPERRNGKCHIFNRWPCFCSRQSGCFHY
ncbi:hypothetical protein Pyn_35742 [Prunus yedoensis var. nudiflora]|uniref:Uncharacterized protein n=1 Tax=Prunus yedoensis var. nudiflora TaxID=2094558 RepID=A0A315A1I0_PRUYE|nr:hypothetical protein Pyn_35742 [Prunus yedoensis var. nudiflora]